MANIIHWFRADLRVDDNTALLAAMQEATQLITVFVLTPQTWKKHGCSPYKVQLILEHLNSLSTELEKQSIPLIISEQECFSDSTSILISLCDQYQIDTVYYNKQYELDELRRDEEVTQALSSLGVSCKGFDDQTIVPPGKIKTLSGEHYKVFTPFKKSWLNEVGETIEFYLPKKNTNKNFYQNKRVLKTRILENIQPFKAVKLSKKFALSEQQAQDNLIDFCKNHLMVYYQHRDFPSLPGTSKLSAALAIGAISARQCLQQIVTITQGNIYSQEKFPGPLTWLSEIIWRDFYKHILYYHPNICKFKAYKKHTDQLPWRSDSSLLEAWQQGRTGFPLVDAGMRQLNQCGWMHNRLRMVTAMFLAKTLFIDWRLGEKYFMEKLIDSDFSSNNGGWQWCASTGTDAVPYFRIFNPTTQSERFDPEGKFIRYYCPELAHLSNRQIHDPYQRGVKIGEIDYPEPIVDYKKMRAYVIEQFKLLDRQD